MQTNTISSPGVSTATTATSAASNGLGTQDFLKILTTQLRNQDPMSPMSNTEFISQMAQLSTLQSTQDMGSQLAHLLATQQRTQALQMVGREVEYNDGTSETNQTGKVSAAVLNETTPVLLIDGKQVPYAQIQSVH